MNKLVTKCLIILFMLGSFYASANIDEIPLPNDFEMRMTLKDDYPMIISGFVKQDIESVKLFYRDNLGEPNLITEDIGRYTYFYTLSGRSVKIGFYQHPEWCEISIMMTES